MPPPRKLAPAPGHSVVDNVEPQPPAGASDSHALSVSSSVFRAPRDPPSGRLMRLSVASGGSAGSGSHPSWYSCSEAPGPIPPDHSPAQPPAQLPAVPVSSESSGTSVSTHSNPHYASNARIVIQNRQFQGELVAIRNQEHVVNNRYRALKAELLTQTQSLKELEMVQDMHLKVRSAAVQEASTDVQARATEHTMRHGTIRQQYPPLNPPAPPAHACMFASAPASAPMSAPASAPASAAASAPESAAASGPESAPAPAPSSAVRSHA
ncbi:hypothetical protein FRC08_005739 [Ceratobasidium sp. 394]|nr:hypothetical protein FRC08_005739 [Ceratobasidium sp. 394]